MKMLLITTIIFFAFIFNVSEMTNLQAFGDNLISQKYPSTMQLLIQSAPNQLNLIPPQDRQIHLKFFDATTTNPVGNVTFVMIVTKGNQIFLQNTFWSQSGSFTLHLKPGERYLWTANPDHDPMDGLYYSKGDQIDIETSYLTDNVYHFSIQPVSVNQNDLSQQKIGGKFGADLNLLSTYNETLAPDANITSSVNQLKILSPLKQFKSGVAANDVKCGQNLQLIIKSEDGSPACVKSDTAQKLTERGWAMGKLDPQFTSMNLEVYGSYGPGTLSGHFLKGSLSSIEGPISNGNVTIYVNGISMGQTVTDLSGCFQFNSWDDKKLSAQINETRQNMEQKGVLDGMNLRVVANYPGDENHDAVNTTKQSYLYLWALPLPPPNYQTTISPSVLNVTQGYPIDFELMVKPFTAYSNVDVMKLSVERMPCGVTDTISYNKGNDRVSTDHPGIFNVTLNTSIYTPTGTYWIMITQDTSGLSNPNIDHDITEFALKVLPKDNQSK